MRSRLMKLVAVAAPVVLAAFLTGCGDDTVQCPAGQQMCDGKCVNYQSGNFNGTIFEDCGACGTDCTAGQTCNGGKCGCGGTTTDCSGKCVTTATDPANCGACGNACKTGEVCNAGKCEGPGACVAPKLDCSGSCIDPQSDSNNCGTCGTKCDATKGFACVAGKCACLGGMTDCSGTCTFPATDPNNCGTCGTKCAAGQVCSNAKCTGGGCVAPQIECAGGCIDPNSDNNNCGACGTKCDTAAGFTCTAGKCACVGGLTDCAGKCVNTAIDGKNCGACGTDCGTGVGCVGGKCATCPTGQTLCNSVCVDTKSDPNNCSATGACGIKCTGGMTCQAGTCACPTGTTNCSGTCKNTTNDPTACGSCTTACPATSPNCVNSVCSGICPAGQTPCGSPPVCSTTSSDPNNCGACGTKCTGGMICSSSVCTCPAALPNNCSGTCYNFQTDDNHCGSCTNVCSGTSTCVAGVCTASPVVGVSVACGTATTVPEKIAIQCTATATLQNGKTVDVTTDAKFTWNAVVGCGSWDGLIKGRFIAGSGCAAPNTATISGQWSGPPVVPSNNLVLTVVATKVTSIAIAPASPKVPKLTGMVVNFKLKCVYDNGLTEDCPAGGTVTWASNNLGGPTLTTGVTDRIGLFPRAAGFVAATDPNGVSTITANLTGSPAWAATLPSTTATTVVTVVGDTFNSLTVQPATATVSAGQVVDFSVIANFNTADTFDVTLIGDPTLSPYTGMAPLAFPLPAATTYISNPVAPTANRLKWQIQANGVTPAGLPAIVRASWTYGATTRTGDLNVTVTGAILTRCYVVQDEKAPPHPGAGALPAPLANDFAKGQVGVPFRAWGYYSNGDVDEITDAVAWSSSAPTIASVSNTTGHKGETNMLLAGAANVTANPSALQAGVANCIYTANVKNATLCTAAGALVVRGKYRGVAPMRRAYSTAPAAPDSNSPLLPNEAGWTQQFVALAKYDTAVTNPCANLGAATVVDVDVTSRATWTATPGTGQPASLTATSTAGLYNTSANATAGNEFRSMTIQAVLTDPAGSTNTATGNLVAYVCGTRQPNTLQLNKSIGTDFSVEDNTAVNMTAGTTSTYQTELRAIFRDANAPAGLGTNLCNTGGGYKLQITEDATNYTSTSNAIVSIDTTTPKGLAHANAKGNATAFAYLGALPSDGLDFVVTDAAITACTLTPVSKTVYTKAGLPAALVQFKATGTLATGQTNVDVTDKVTWAFTASTGCAWFDGGVAPQVPTVPPAAPLPHPGLVSANAAGNTCKITATAGGVTCTPVPNAEPYISIQTATLASPYMFIQTSDKTCYDAPAAAMTLSASTSTNLYACLVYNTGFRVAMDLVAGDDATNLLGWGSSNTNVALVDNTGLVGITGTPSGSATITATYSGTTPATTATVAITGTSVPVSSIAFQSANIGATGCALLNLAGPPAVTMEACEAGGTHVAYRVLGTRSGLPAQDLTDMIAPYGAQTPLVITPTAHGSDFAPVAGRPGWFTVAGTAGYLDLAATVTIGTNPQLSTAPFQVGVTASTATVTALTLTSPTSVAKGASGKLTAVATVAVVGGTVLLNVSNDANYTFQTVANGGRPDRIYIVDTNDSFNGWMIGTDSGTTVLYGSFGGTNSANRTITVP